jgi:glycine cleavage system aminomethyltransferase T
MLFKTDTKARSEHDAVRTNVGWYRWTHDLVEVTGADAATFLNHIYVNSIAEAKVGQSKYTTMLSDEGTIIDDVIVMRLEDERFWISTLYAPRLLPWLDMHKGKSLVEYRERTYEIDMYAVQGPQSLAMMNALLDTPIDGLERFALSQNKIGASEVWVHRGGFTGELGYEILCDLADSAAVCAAIRKSGASFDATEMTTLEVYVRSLPMEKGLALRQDLYGLTPEEAGLGWSVDMSKDFIGKPALEKAAQEGAKRKLVGLELEADSYQDITLGERIFVQGKDVGAVRAMIYAYTIDKNIGFAVVDAAYAEPGTEIAIGSYGSPATIVKKQWL